MRWLSSRQSLSSQSCPGIKAVIDLIKTKKPADGTIRIALHEFSADLVTLSPLTSDLQAVATAADKIDLMTGEGGGSYISYALERLAAKIGTGGDGSSSAGPLSYVVLMTDGIDDSAEMKLHPGTSYYDVTYGPNANWRTTNPSRQPAIADGDKATLQSFSATPCGTLKQKNHKVLSVQIKYIAAVGFRQLYDKPKINYIQGELAQPLTNAFLNCVTSPSIENYKLAQDSTAIVTVLQQIVNEVIIPTSYGLQTDDSPLWTHVLFRSAGHRFLKSLL